MWAIILLVFTTIFGVGTIISVVNAYNAGQGTSTGDLGGFILWAVITVLALLFTVGFGIWTKLIW